MGRFAPTTEKPLPLAAAPLMESVDEPVDFSVTDWVAGEFNATFPKERLLELQLMVAVAGVNRRLNVLET